MLFDQPEASALGYPTSNLTRRNTALCKRPPIKGARPATMFRKFDPKCEQVGLRGPTAPVPTNRKSELVDESTKVQSKLIQADPINPMIVVYYLTSLSKSVSIRLDQSYEE